MNDEEGLETENSTPSLILMIAIVLLVLSLSSNVYLFKLTRVKADEINMQKQNVGIAQQRVAAVGALVNDLRAYGETRPQVRQIVDEVMGQFGIQYTPPPAGTPPPGGANR